MFTVSEKQDMHALNYGGSSSPTSNSPVLNLLTFKKETTNMYTFNYVKVQLSLLAVIITVTQIKLLLKWCRRHI